MISGQFTINMLIRINDEMSTQWNMMINKWSPLRHESKRDGMQPQQQTHVMMVEGQRPQSALYFNNRLIYVFQHKFGLPKYE